jgi:hypothetical protein
MQVNEISDFLNQKTINSKVNNYIFTNLSKSEQISVLEQLNKKSNYSYLEKIEGVDVLSEADTIYLDLSMFRVRDILNEVLSLEKISADIPFLTRKDLVKFRFLLRENQKMVQLIFDKFYSDLTDQMLLNELMAFHTDFFNANFILTEDNLSTYFLSGNRILDDREDYQKINTKSLIRFHGGVR